MSDSLNISFDTLDEEGFILNAAYIEDYAGKHLQKQYYDQS